MLISSLTKFTNISRIISFGLVVKLLFYSTLATGFLTASFSKILFKNRVDEDNDKKSVLSEIFLKPWKKCF